MYCSVLSVGVGQLRLRARAQLAAQALHQRGQQARQAGCLCLPMTRLMLSAGCGSNPSSVARGIDAQHTHPIAMLQFIRQRMIEQAELAAGHALYGLAVDAQFELAA